MERRGILWRAWRAVRGWPRRWQVAAALGAVFLVSAVAGALNPPEDRREVVAGAVAERDGDGATTTERATSTTTTTAAPRQTTTTVAPRQTTTTVAARPASQSPPALSPAPTTTRPTPATAAAPPLPTAPPRTAPPPTAPPPTQPPPTQPPPTSGPSCHPEYTGACVPPHASDVDCGGGSGNGPEYVHEKDFQSIGSDPYGLDADGDGVACES
jgi:hypothetical protein